MTDLTKLDAEFIDGEVQQRPGSALYSHKDACPGKSCRETRDPAKHMQFDYIEDETVMDRLDEVLGKGEWSLQVEPISVADGIVKVTLSALGGTYEDFGYSSNASGESLKEAVSDGIRRCGRYLGVGRYLYKKHVSASTGRAGAPSSSARPAAPPRSSTAVPEEPDWMDEGAPTPIRRQAASDNSECPEHGVTWNGEFGDLWHKTEDGRYCRHPENTRQEGRKAARR